MKVNVVRFQSDKPTPSCANGGKRDQSFRRHVRHHVDNPAKYSGKGIHGERTSEEFGSVLPPLMGRNIVCRPIGRSFIRCWGVAKAFSECYRNIFIER